jgi:integrase
MAKGIQTVSGREKLKVRHEPHWLLVRKGCFLGFVKRSESSSGAWRARYRDDSTGKRTSHSLGSFDHLLPNERYSAALEAAEKWFKHMGAGGRSEALTVHQVCERYVQHLRDSRREDAAVDAAGRFRRWVPEGSALGRIPVDKLTHAHVREWRLSLSKTPAIPQNKKSTEPSKSRSESAVNRDMTALRAALNFALQERHVTTAAAWLVALKPVPNADRRRGVYLDSSQRRVLLEKCPPDLANLVRTLSELPLRPGAAAKLKVRDFDRRSGELSVTKDKGGRSRRIGLPESTVEFFTRMSQNKLPEAPLISRGDGSHWNRHSWKKQFKEAAVAAGLPPATVMYALRHSAITDLLTLHRLDTMSVSALSDTSLAMIERHYGHLVNRHAKEALAGLAL